MIELKNLTKVYKDKVAVDNLSFDIKPGIVTGFLGPNGAGKSTTMRMILNLVKPSKGEVIIDGKHYKDLNKPISKIGALIDADALNAKLTALQHLQLIATASGILSSRVIEMLEKTGLEKVKNKQIEEYSLGMKQRLGIAAALLGNPETIILDEPFNGLDVDGIKWLSESDIDIGIYYDKETLDLVSLNKIGGYHVDVRSAHYQTGHPHAYINVMYMDCGTIPAQIKKSYY